jgi:type VI secretion system secreted protein VgrG
MAAGFPFELMIDGLPPGHLRVHTLSGRERLSEVWRFDVIVTAPVGDDVEVASLGRRATLLFDLDDRQRAFYGIVASAHLVEVHAVDHRVKYAVRVVPRLWLLRRKKRSRVFQRMRVPDIVSAVLLEEGIMTRWQLTRPYPEREYCT